MKNEYDFEGKNYCFKVGKITDEMIEECRALLKEYCKNLVDDDEINTNTIGYTIGTGAREISDALLFESAIANYKEFLRKQIQERNKHIILVNEEKDFM